MRTPKRLTCAHPLHETESLCTPSTDAGAPVQWNFESFLVTKGGTVHKRFATGVDLTARESTSVLEMLLAEKDEL